MNRDRSSTKLKISSIRRSAILGCCTVAALWGCSAPNYTRVPPVSSVRESNVEVRPVASPWQTWGAETFGMPEMALGVELEQSGKLAEAVDAYGNALRVAPENYRSEIALRRSNVLLKMGRAREVLDFTSQLFAEEGRSIEAADPRTAFLVAFAYERLGELDQALSWQGVAYRNDQKRSVISERAAVEVRRVVRGINVDTFDIEESKWVGDSFIGPIFTAERLRRASGGRPEAVSMARWFDPVTYGGVAVAAAGSVASQQPTESNLINLSDEGFVLGALVPLSGRFAEHGQRVREGIELAVRDANASGQIVRLEVVDEAGDPLQAAQEYEKLSSQGAQFVLGPLLVNTTKSVATVARNRGVPFLTFTKREGIRDAQSSQMFRLGVTADSQTSELVNYVTSILKKTRFAILFPNSESGRELADSFRQNVAKAKGQLVSELSYDVLSDATVEGLTKTFATMPVDAIFVADALENAGPYLERIRAANLANVIFLGPASWDDRAALRGFERVLNGALFVTPYSSSSSDPEIVSFRERFQQQYGSEPGLLSAQAYDAARIVLQGARTATPLDPKVRQQLVREIKKVDQFNGVTGLLSVTPGGEVKRRMTVLRVSGSDIVEVMARGEKRSFSGDEQQGNFALENANRPSNPLLQP